MVAKLEKNGIVAVLVSPGFGAGWSTWNRDHCPEIVFDPEIVEAVLNEDRNLAANIATKKYPNCYDGGTEDLMVEWLPVGTVFEIEEYAGSETIHVICSRKYYTA